MTAPGGWLIWITGRAATGKSTVIAALIPALHALGIDATVHSDEAILLHLVAADTDHRHHWHPDGEHRIAWRDGHLFDQSLTLLNTRLLADLHAGRVAVVELARGQHTPPVDVTYRRALQLLDPRLWVTSIVFRLDVDFQTQLDRNAARRTGTGAGTPEPVMRELYQHDDPDTLDHAGIAYLTLPAINDPATTAGIILTTFQDHRRHNMWGLGASLPTTCSEVGRLPDIDPKPSRRTPVLTTTRPAVATTRITVTPPARQRPARARHGHSYDFDINGMAGQLHVTELADGGPGEVFLHIGKQGSTLRGLCETLSISTSLALQHHTPLTDIIGRLANMRFEPAGTTNDPDIPTCTSIADYLARRLAADYLPAEDRTELGLDR